MNPVKVFVSSTCYDLAEVRAQLQRFITNLGHEAIMSDMGDVLFDPREHTHASCVNEVESADILVLIIGGRFGGDAVPQALSILDDNIPIGARLSITQVEAKKAIQQGIPIYTFIRKNVNHDHLVYERNKASGGAAHVTFPSIDKADTAQYIFEFVNFIRHLKNGNGLYEFASVFDIETHLSRQWSAYFQKLLVEQRAAASRPLAILEQLGLKRISFRGSVDTGDLSPRIRLARSVKVMFASGNTFLTTRFDDLRDCIKSGGELRILLAEPGGAFVEDIECMEGRASEFGISKEIEASVVRLRRLVDEAARNISATASKPTVAYGFFRTHLRMSLIIIDDRYCYAILNYSPKRTSESLALLFDADGLPNNGPVQHIIEHFDVVFAQLDNNNKIERLQG